MLVAAAQTKSDMLSICSYLVTKTVWEAGEGVSSVVGRPALSVTHFGEESPKIRAGGAYLWGGGMKTVFTVASVCIIYSASGICGC